MRFSNGHFFHGITCNAGPSIPMHGTSNEPHYLAHLPAVLYCTCWAHAPSAPMCGPMWRGTPLAEMDKLILRIIGSVYTPPLLALSTQGNAGSRTALIKRVRLGIRQYQWRVALRVVRWIAPGAMMLE